MLIRDFLSPDEHQRLFDYALACEGAFQDSEVEAKDGIDVGARLSRTLSSNPLEAVWDLFDRRLRAILPAVRQELGIPWFPLGEVERQLTAHAGSGSHGPL